MFDPALAKEMILSVYGVLAAIVIGALGLWFRIAKTRQSVGAQDGDRVRLTDAIADARLAREEAHAANNSSMAVQRQIGRLEAENRACTRRSRVQAVQIGRLQRQNAEQATQLRDLSRALKARYNPTDSDLGPM